MTALSTETLDIVEQIESASTLTAVLDPSTISSALDTAPTLEPLLIADLIARGIIEPCGCPNGYVLTSDAQEGLRERWARGWAETFWPSSP